MIQKLLPPNNILNDHLRTFLFDAPPLFYRPSNHFTSKMGLQIEAIQQEQANLALRLQKRGIIEDAITQIRNTSSSVGQSLRSLYDSTSQKLTEGVNEIKWSIIYLVLWISVPTFIILTCIAFCVIYVKLYCVRTTTSTAASTLFNIARYFAPKRRNKRKRAVNVLLTELQLDPDREEQLFVPCIYALHTNNASLPYLNVSIGDNAITALLDSGATISYMRNSTVRSMGNHIPLTMQKTTAITANGSPIRLLASTQLPVRIGTHTIFHQFHIAANDESPAPLLLGSDFIRALNGTGLVLSMDLHQQKLRIGSDTLNLVQLNHIAVIPKTTYDVCIAGNTTLPRRSNNVVPAKIEGLTPPICSAFLIEDNLRPMNDIYVVGRALVSPTKEGSCFINTLNPSQKDIQLPDRIRIALAHPACTSELQVHALHIPYPASATSEFTEMSSATIGSPYTPPEADWESKLPSFPVLTPRHHDIANDIDLSQSALTDVQKQQLLDILRYHTNAFVGPDGHLGHYKGPIRHRIDLIENATIPTRKIYRVPLEKRQEIEKQITQMLKEGIILESSSPFCAPIVLVKKREANTWRFTIDFRGLNAITKPQQSILPDIQDIIDLCANQCLYTSLDFQQGFHQIPLQEEHCERTAFACFLGAFEYIHMPMGLKGAPATFQRIMDDFKKYLRARVFIYIDDLIITSATPDEHLTDIDEVLGKIELIGMKLKASKCEFAKQEITFLGFVLSKDGIRPNPEKTKAIDAYRTPKNATDVKSFLGMCSFFRRFIHNFANIAAPLTALTKKDNPFNWTSECDEAVMRLKAALRSAPILAAPRLGQPFLIETDSSSKGVAGVLKQEQDDTVRVIAYASRTLNKHEARYPAIELEALGLVFAVQKFRPYIDGAKCTVITDHAPLKALLHRKDLTGRLAKYQIVLQEFDIEIVYRPGKRNVVCDTLSRHLPPAANAFTSLQPDNLDLEKIRTEQNQCAWMTQYKEALKQGEVLPELLDYILINDLLYRLPPRLHQDPQLVIPEDSPIRNDIISTVHQSQMGTAHLGVTKTRAAVAKIAIWNNMAKDIMQFVTSCRQCQSRKDPSTYRLREPLQRFEITTKPWQRIHSDVIGPLLLTLDGNKYIIVFIDSFSKFIVAEPLPDQKANTTSQTFINRFVARFGLPEMLVTDQGANYMSDTFRSLLRNLHITHRTSTPYHHESNGQVERANRTLQEQIAIATDQHHDQWDNVLPLIVHAYNSAESASTKYSPHFLVHGSEPTNIFQLALRLPTKKFADEDDYVSHLTNVLKTIYSNTCANLIATQEQQKRHYDLRKRVKKANYQIGQQVWIRKDGSNKITTRFEGPFKILDVNYPNITFKDGRRERSVHINRTKPYQEKEDDNH
ncbi:integrase core domain protein [Ancylostoma duodenale]|uniref:RNA-directed DNA polymerase n=1 Tax=Ancylostoma duodenale TaxID=51022 RepID=A0A0C2GWW8_9BILA|nr:integrase core domain protein [Ancylostoma duodenale]